ncbi:MAG TPA: LLM class flavin-dependent oxidoreductase [Dehalococcoidia bacterium]|nr:LLM class flavin-dependent oxidoreductase [Dehalococcoidia bacterium]
MAPDSRDGDGAEARPGVPFRLGVFTRMVDAVAPAELYARALSLFEAADTLGFDTGWVAQHHGGKTGGMPAPLVFLGNAAARTRRLRLATGIITLPLEQPLRLAEDAAVLDTLCGGRLELGFGTGGAEAVFPLFGREVDRRQEDYDRAFAVVRDALAGKPLAPGGPPLFPAAPRLAGCLWEATFGVEGAVRAAEHGSGLLLARTASRAAPGVDGPAEHRPLGEVQAPLVEAYLAHWRPDNGRPRIGLSRSLYVAPTRAEAIADAAPGIRRHAEQIRQRSGLRGEPSVEDLLRRADVHIGSPADMIESLRQDQLLPQATDLILQVHPVDPPHEKTLRSFELLAHAVAPALGWRPAERERTGSLAAAGR